MNSDVYEIRSEVALQIMGMGGKSAKILPAIGDRVANVGEKQVQMAAARGSAFYPKLAFIK